MITMNRRLASVLCAGAVTVTLGVATCCDGGPPTGAAVRTLVGKVMDDITAQVDEIDAPAPPEEMSADVATLLEQARTGIAAIREDPEALFAAENPLTETNRTAARIGLTDCAG